jgi:hypothetical protein
MITDDPDNKRKVLESPQGSPFTDILIDFASFFNFDPDKVKPNQFQKELEDAEAAILQVLAEAIGEDEAEHESRGFVDAQAVQRNELRQQIRAKLGINGEGKQTDGIEENKNHE